MKQNYLTEVIHLINMLLQSKTFLFEKARYDNIFFMNAPLSNLEDYGASLFGVNPNLNESNYTYFDIYKIDNTDEYTQLIEKKFDYDNMNSDERLNINDLEITSKEFRNNGIFDLLGKYVINNAENEGEIIIYHRAIKKYSELLRNKYFPNKTLDDIYEALFKIVLWHEMGHWTSHWLENTNNNRWNNPNYKYVSQEDIDLHEGLAQAFTHWAILFYDENEYPLLNTIFTLMTLSQPSQYKTYYKIISKTNDFYKFLDAISEIRKLTYPPELKDLLKNL